MACTRICAPSLPMPATSGISVMTKLAFSSCVMLAQLISCAGPMPTSGCLRVVAVAVAAVRLFMTLSAPATLLTPPNFPNAGVKLKSIPLNDLAIGASACTCLTSVACLESIRLFQEVATFHMALARVVLLFSPNPFIIGCDSCSIFPFASFTTFPLSSIFGTTAVIPTAPLLPASAQVTPSAPPIAFLMVSSCPEEPSNLFTFMK